jgi:hypothetical protein
MPTGALLQSDRNFPGPLRKGQSRGHVVGRFWVRRHRLGGPSKEIFEVASRDVERIGQLSDVYSDFQNAIRDFISHMDSLALARESRRRYEALADLDRDEVYRECSEIIALYQQALLRWPGNTLAAEGLIQVRDTFAGVAIKRGEFLLAQSQARAIEQEKKQYNLALRE